MDPSQYKIRYKYRYEETYGNKTNKKLPPDQVPKTETNGTT